MTEQQQFEEYGRQLSACVDNILTGAIRDIPSNFILVEVPYLALGRFYSRVNESLTHIASDTLPQAQTLVDTIRGVIPPQSERERIMRLGEDARAYQWFLLQYVDIANRTHEIGNLHGTLMHQAGLSHARRVLNRQAALEAYRELVEEPLYTDALRPHIQAIKDIHALWISTIPQHMALWSGCAKGK